MTSVHPELVEGLNTYLKLNPFMVRKAQHERVYIFFRNSYRKTLNALAFKLLELLVDFLFFLGR